MGIKIGAANISKLYLGSQEISKAYLGATLVYDAAPAPSYLLDTYTGAIAAYSLRQLRTGVTSVVRVRRSGDDVEADFTATEITNSTLTTWTGASDFFITELKGQDTSSTPDSEPIIGNQIKLGTGGVLNLLDGKPSGFINFQNAFNQRGYSPFKHTTGYTMVFVGKSNLEGRARVISNGVNNNLLQLDNNGTLDIRNGAGVSGGNGGVGSSGAIFQVYIRQTQGVLIRANKNTPAIDNTTAVFTDSAVNSILEFTLATGEFQEVILWPENLESVKDDLTDAINSYYAKY
jgi:hypothetical protein